MEPIKTMNEMHENPYNDMKEKIRQGFKRFQELMKDPKFKEIVYDAMDQLIINN